MQAEGPALFLPRDNVPIYLIPTGQSPSKFEQIENEWYNISSYRKEVDCAMFNVKKAIVAAFTTAVITASMLGSAVATELSPAAFSDVPETHPAYSAVQAAYADGLICGSGDGRFVPDAQISVPELCSIMLNYTHAPAMEIQADSWVEAVLIRAEQAGLISKPEAKNEPCSWIYVLKQAMNLEDLPAYSAEVWQEPGNIQGYTHPEIAVIVSAIHYGLLDGQALDEITFTDAPTRAQAVQVFYNLSKNEKTSARPAIVENFTFVTDEGVKQGSINTAYQALLDVPEQYLNEFKVHGWTFYLTSKRIHEIPDFEMHTTAAGITSYRKKAIYVSQTYGGIAERTIRHELGHFAEKVAVKKYLPEKIFRAEQEALVSAIRPYTGTSPSEAFADLFDAIAKNQNNPTALGQLMKAVPECFDFVTENYFAE